MVLKLPRFFVLSEKFMENFEQKKGEADSIAGFIIENTGSLPEKGQKINFENYTFSIESVNDRRINRIKVTLPEVINHNE